MASATDIHRVSGRIQEIARKLERHILASGLKPGDRYITAEEGGKLVGESKMSVQRAMALLARQNFLERRPKAGTFIGPALRRRVTRSSVHFLLPEQIIGEANKRGDYWGTLCGIRSTLPDISIQCDFIPNQDLGYVREIIEPAWTEGSLMGVVVILPSRAMRVFFNQSGIPTVVMGGVEADLPNLCWLLWDQMQTGRLLASWLLERGHNRLVTVMRDIWSIGEHLLHDGINDVLASAGLTGNALQIRSTPSERLAITEMIRGMLTQDANPRRGFICRTVFQADCVQEVVDELKLADEVDVVLCNAPQPSSEQKYTSVVPVMDTAEQGRIIGTMLKNMNEGKRPDPRGLHIGVRLCPRAERRG